LAGSLGYFGFIILPFYGEACFTDFGITSAFMDKTYNTGFE
jgi:hypothetical protein